MEEENTLLSSTQVDTFLSIDVRRWIGNLEE